MNLLWKYFPSIIWVVFWCHSLEWYHYVAFCVKESNKSTQIGQMAFAVSVFASRCYQITHTAPWTGHRQCWSTTNNEKKKNSVQFAVKHQVLRELGSFFSTESSLVHCFSSLLNKFRCWKCKLLHKNSYIKDSLYYYDYKFSFCAVFRIN